MNNIYHQFTIKDLENLSGIKAHTIRIWEKRYNILNPERTDSNVRMYDTSNLKKLLNVTYLYNGGHKISKIAQLSEADLNQTVIDQVSKRGDHVSYMDSLVLSMLNFDQSHFEQTFNRLISEFSFRHVFLKVFIPLLHRIGIYWQSDNIMPVHEHFISSLIKQKVQISIERAQQTIPKVDGMVYVMFLPENEIHELSLMYLQYELMLRGHQAIYLGKSVPMSNLKALQAVYKQITFVSYFTIKPASEEVEIYLQQFSRILLKDRNDLLWVGGRNVQNHSKTFPDVKLFSDLNEMINKM
ncbi:MAG: DNA-binding transcriptional MerR regulator [bacterium]